LRKIFIVDIYMNSNSDSKSIYPRALLALAVFISLAAGCLALTVEMLTQYYFLQIEPKHLLFPNLIFALIISCTAFTISIVNIYLMPHQKGSPNRTMRKQLLLNLLFSSVPLFGGLFATKLLGYVISDGINLKAIIHKQEPTSMSTLWIFIILFILTLNFSSILIYVILNYPKNVITKQRLEVENATLRAESIEVMYQQLKQQVNPHFLFNTLSTLKTLIHDNPDAEIYLKRLSDFLRTSVSYNNKNTLILGEELKFCLDYLELQKVRFGEALLFSIRIPENVKSGFVPVFSIQQLIENAIKHNALTVSQPLHIKIDYSDERVVVSNNIKRKNTSEESLGVGLINLAERYRILSGDEVIIKTENNCFLVSIKILDHENSNHRG
jgi:two-component system, LytTR family, sensor kinase